MSPVRNCTLCLIKPHVLRTNEAGALLEAIVDAGFNLEGLFSIHMSVPIAEHLMDVYRGVYTSYAKAIEQLCSGPLLAVMVSGDEGVVSQFREFCGPLEPELAKVLRPHSLRARFGVDFVHNAVHCTDLPEDGEMEVRYVFETLAGL
jgi:nucleoside-diphosphate kinase